jgi:hypothetical protein
MTDVTIGDDVTVLATLRRGGAVVNLASATSVKFAVKDALGRLVGSVITAASGDAGANWTTGVVACIFPAAATTAWAQDALTLEIQVIQGGVRSTWRQAAILQPVQGVIP